MIKDLENMFYFFVRIQHVRGVGKVHQELLLTLLNKGSMKRTEEKNSRGEHVSAVWLGHAAELL